MNDDTAEAKFRKALIFDPIDAAQRSDIRRIASSKARLAERALDSIDQLRWNGSRFRRFVRQTDKGKPITTRDDDGWRLVCSIDTHDREHAETRS
jgi:hypothetical protein